MQFFIARFMSPKRTNGERRFVFEADGRSTLRACRRLPVRYYREAEISTSWDSDTAHIFGSDQNSLFEAAQALGGEAFELLEGIAVGVYGSGLNAGWRERDQRMNLTASDGSKKPRRSTHPTRRRHS